MALNAYLKVKGQIQGEIKGSVTQKGREGSIMVIAASHDIISPRDPASGVSIGKRSHKPFVITKELDKSSPLLYSMLVNNEGITEWELQFWQPNSTGGETNYYTVRLTNANVASIGFRMPNSRDPELMKRVEYEDLAFVYRKIQWVWTEGNISAADDWQTHVA
jgi:type VI secretion system secreted protein Hcp